jgi:hypothetical protein
MFFMSFMPKRGGADWVSRDYDLPVIPCRVTDCACNNGRGSCTMPSAISINAAGQCEEGLKYKE